MTVQRDLQAGVTQARESVTPATRTVQGLDGKSYAGALRQSAPPSDDDMFAYRGNGLLIPLDARLARRPHLLITLWVPVK